MSKGKAQSPGGADDGAEASPSKVTKSWSFTDKNRGAKNAFKARGSTSRKNSEGEETDHHLTRMSVVVLCSITEYTAIQCRDLENSIVVGGKPQKLYSNHHENCRKWQTLIKRDVGVVNMKLHSGHGGPSFCMEPGSRGERVAASSCVSSLCSSFTFSLHTQTWYLTFQKNSSWVHFPKFPGIHLSQYDLGYLFRDQTLGVKIIYIKENWKQN